MTLLIAIKIILNIIVELFIKLVSTVTFAFAVFIIARLLIRVVYVINENIVFAKQNRTFKVIKGGLYNKA